MTKHGIMVRCVSCKARKLLSFEEAAALDTLPQCDRCYSPMVAVEAKVKL